MTLQELVTGLNNFSGISRYGALTAENKLVKIPILEKNGEAEIMTFETGFNELKSLLKTMNGFINDTMLQMIEDKVGRLPNGDGTKNG